MEFIKVGKNYMIKNSNGRIVTEEEKIKLENRELVLNDIKCCNCQAETTKKISKNKNRLKTLEALKDLSPIVKGTALTEGVGVDDIIKETTESI